MERRELRRTWFVHCRAVRFARQPDGLCSRHGVARRMRFDVRRPLLNRDAQFRQHTRQNAAFLLEDRFQVVFSAIGFDSPQTGAFDPG